MSHCFRTIVLVIIIVSASTSTLRAGSAYITPSLASTKPLATVVSSARDCGIVERDDVIYGQYCGATLRLNIIEPAAPSLVPMRAVVWIHGGGWHAGNRYSGLKECIYLARRGYFCASIDYRLSQDAVWPAQIEDCQCAIRFIRANSKRLHVDPERIGAWGESSGGHLAALLGTVGTRRVFARMGANADTPCNVQAVCDWYGPTDIGKMQAEGSDLSPDDPLSAPSLLFGTGGLNRHKDAIRDANPCVYASPVAPPFLVLHGDSDMSVPLAQSQLLIDSLKHYVCNATLVVLKGAKHMDPVFETKPILDRCASFFDSAFARSAEPPVTPLRKSLAHNQR